jgi:predicted acyltransferase
MRGGGDSGWPDILIIAQPPARLMPNEQSITSSRLVSIDALRGFDMLMIAGAGAVIHQLEGKTGWGWVDAVARQFTHPAWFGFTFYDCIFPLFLFLAGVSIPFSLAGAIAKGTPGPELYRKAFVRLLILIVLGMLDKNAPFPFFDPHHIRMGSVLGRIGLAGFVSVVLYLNVGSARRLAIAGGILFLYYAALMLVPVPGFGAGNLSFEGNLVGWFDRTFLPGRLLQVTYDELGILTQFPAMCLTMLGVHAGEILKDSSFSQQARFRRLLIAGMVCLGLGLLWSLHFPIAKRLWTSSFILVTSGLSFTFMAVFYGIIDVVGFKKWAFPLVVVGMNSLTIYMTFHFVDFGHTSKLLFAGLYQPLDPKWHGVLESLGALLLVWSFLFVLYRNKIFFKA